MQPDFFSRRLAMSLIASIVLGAVAGLTATAAPREVPPPPIDLSTRTGVGEQLLIVVAGQYPSEAGARAAVEDLSFGDMQGFYVDAAVNYVVIGAYDQSSPDFQPVDCEALPSQAKTCGGQSVQVALPVSLEYIPVERLGALFESARTAQCGQLGEIPCMAVRLQSLLVVPGYQLDASTFLALTAFRTKKGAEEFVEVARNRGYSTTVIRTRKVGGPYVGLGQEANPDGVSGPLIDPLPDPDSFQI